MQDYSDVFMNTLVDFPLVQISEHLKDSIVYLDAGCTESFQYLGAFNLLLNLGVSTVCSLENMSPVDLVISP